MQFEIKGLTRVKGIISRLKRRFVSFNPVWDDIRDVFFEIEERRFATKNKGRWRPLNPNYAAWKNAHFPGRPLMVLTGDLKKSLTSMSKDTVYKPGRRHMEIGTKTKYALAQHFGTRERGGGRGQSRLPPRPLISITKPDIKKFQKVMDRYLDKIVKRAK